MSKPDSKPITFWGIPLVFEQRRIVWALKFQSLYAVFMMAMLFFGFMDKTGVMAGMIGVLLGSTLSTIGIDFMKGGKHAIIYAFVMLGSLLSFVFV